MAMRVISMGAGVQTTAMLLKYADTVDACIFADTGDEKKQTMWFIETYLKPFCKEHGIDWYTVRDPDYVSLSDYCNQKEWVPNVTRLITGRLCTNQFKIRPINRKLRELGATAKKPIDIWIGISIDEVRRLKANAFVDKPKYAHKVYPFLDDKVSREDCYRIITDFGWPIPIKSGCDFCPFAGKKAIRNVAGSDPDRYEYLVQLDKADARGMHFFDTPLTHSQRLDDFSDIDFEPVDVCESGHCMR